MVSPYFLISLQNYGFVGVSGHRYCEVDIFENEDIVELRPINWSRFVCKRRPEVLRVSS